MFEVPIKVKRTFQGVLFVSFSAFMCGCAGGDIGCFNDVDHEPEPVDSWVGGGDPNAPAPFLPLTNEVALTQDGVLWILNVQTDFKRTVRGETQGFAEPVMSSKGLYIACVNYGATEGAKPVLTAEATFPIPLMRILKESGRPCLDPTPRVSYALVPAKKGDETTYRIYKTYPDRREDEILTDGTTDVHDPCVSPANTQYVYARTVSANRNELYIDSVTANPDAGTLLYSPPANHNVGLPFWGWEGGAGMIYFQINNPDGSSSIAKIRPDGSNFAVIKSTTGIGGGLNGSPVQVRNGRIVFHSFDSGNMDIWSMEPDGTDLKNHTKSPAVQERMRNFFQS